MKTIIFNFFRIKKEGPFWKRKASSLFPVLLLALSLFQAGTALAVSEQETLELAMYFDPEELMVVSATRKEKPIRQVAERIIGLLA